MRGQLTDPRLERTDEDFKNPHHYRFWTVCPGPCGRKLSRRKTQIDPDTLKAKHACPSCRMKGKKNRNPTYQIGETWLMAGYMQIKIAKNKVIPLARHLMSQHLGRPLTKNEHVRFKDQNPRNCDLSNLYIKALPTPNEPLTLEEIAANGLATIAHVSQNQGTTARTTP